MARTIIGLHGVIHEESSKKVDTESSVETSDSHKALNTQQNKVIPVEFDAHIQTPMPRVIYNLSAAYNLIDQKIQPHLADEESRTMSESFHDSSEDTEKQSSRMREKLLLGFLLVTVLATLGSILFFNFRNVEPTARAIRNSPAQSAAFSSFASSYFNKLITEEGDEDNDQLTNREEFLIGSNPTKLSTCNNGLTDSQTLYALIDVSTCEKINFDDLNRLHILEQVIDIARLNREVQSSSSQANTAYNPDNLLTLFGVSSLSEIDFQATRELLIADEKQLDAKKEYIVLIAKIDAFIEKYRSYGPFDRNYAVPVHPAVYLQSSIRYKVPLKYMMAIARLESRFGTDRFTDSGADTRPGKYKNIFSLGLDDSNNNIEFIRWEDGVDSFGKWYAAMEAKGYDDCTKWKIYNPNGNYCAKVEENAEVFEQFVVEKKR